mgnify:CR=1 FL=1
MTTPPIILVPGFWLGAWAWDEVAGLLAGLPQFQLGRGLSVRPAVVAGTRQTFEISAMASLFDPNRNTTSSTVSEFSLMSFSTSDFGVCRSSIFLGRSNSMRMV